MLTTCIENNGQQNQNCYHLFCHLRVFMLFNSLLLLWLLNPQTRENENNCKHSCKAVFLLRNRGKYFQYIFRITIKVESRQCLWKIGANTYQKHCSRITIKILQIKQIPLQKRSDVLMSSIGTRSFTEPAPEQWYYEIFLCGAGVSRNYYQIYLE